MLLLYKFLKHITVLLRKKDSYSTTMSASDSNVNVNGHENRTGCDIPSKPRSESDTPVFSTGGDQGNSVLQGKHSNVCALSSVRSKPRSDSDSTIRQTAANLVMNAQLFPDFDLDTELADVLAEVDVLGRRVEIMGNKAALEVARLNRVIDTFSRTGDPKNEGLHRHNSDGSSRASQMTGRKRNAAPVRRRNSQTGPRSKNYFDRGWRQLKRMVNGSNTPVRRRSTCLLEEEDKGVHDLMRSNTQRSSPIIGLGPGSLRYTPVNERSEETGPRRDPQPDNGPGELDESIVSDPPEKVGSATSERPSWFKHQMRAIADSWNAPTQNTGDAVALFDAF